MLREKPYQLLYPHYDFQRWISSLRVGERQVLHGCRQLVSWDVRLSPSTSATLILICHQVMLGTIRKLPTTSWRKVGMMSSHHGPYGLGYTHATMVVTTGSNIAIWSQSFKSHLSSDWGLQLALMKLELLVIADQHAAVNTFSGLVHTARQAMGVVSTWIWWANRKEVAIHGRNSDWG